MVGFCNFAKFHPEKVIRKTPEIREFHRITLSLLLHNTVPSSFQVSSYTALQIINLPVSKNLHGDTNKPS